MFGKIAAFEYRFQIRQPVFWVVAIIFFLLSFGIVAASGVISVGYGVNIHRNGPFALAQIHMIFATLYMFVTTAFVANVIVRDDETGFGPLIRSTRIGKFDYLYGRFAGAFLAALVSFLAVPLGQLLGSLMPWVDRETLGPVFVVRDYLYAFFVIGAPALLFTATAFFALATVTRSMMWSYVGVVAVFVLRTVLLFTLGQLDLRELSAFLDPFGGAAFATVTRYWTVSEMNSQVPALAGVLLWNKLIWLAVSAGFLALAYPLFRWRTAAPKARRAGRKLVTAPPAPHARGSRATTIVVGALPKPRFGPATALAQMAARTRLDMVQVFTSPAYFVLLAIGVLFAVFSLWFEVNVSLYGGVIHPVTRVMISRLTTSFTIIPLIIAVYYAGEMVWRERERKTAELIDASAVPNWAFVAPKVLAISLVLISTLLAGVVVAVAIQAARGYDNFEIGKYLLWLVLPQSADFILIAIFAVFVQVLSPHKFIGWAVMVVYQVILIVGTSYGFDHNLYLYGGAPVAPLSDMNGQGRFWIGAWWFRAYWACFALVLLVLANALWNRGVETRLKPRLAALPRRLLGPGGVVMGLALAAFAGTGCFIFVNTNIWNTYRSAIDNERWQADYEKALLPFENLPQPKIVAINLKVDIHPGEPSLVTRGSYVLENRTGAVLKEVHVSFDRDLKVQGLSIQGARPKMTDVDYDRFNYRIFTFDTPMQPGERRTMSFITELSERGFRNSDDETLVVDNGTFVNSDQIAPRLGVAQATLLKDRSRRKLYEKKPGISPDPERLKPAGDPATAQVNGLRKDADFVTSDITVTTDADQTPLAPGDLISSSVTDGRRTARFVSNTPILAYFSVQSARYKLRTMAYKGVQLEVYYDRAHPWNIDRMFKAMQMSLDYDQANFSPFQFHHLRFLEFPAYGNFAQSFAGTIPWSENLGFIADYSDPDKIDMVTYVGAHEIGHQWWAHQLIGADQRGGAMLSETLAQYSALMVMKHAYGEPMIRKFLKFELDRYLSQRGGDVLGELPLGQVEDQQYLYYNKGSLVMYRLADEIGEANVNAALRDLLARFAFRGAPYPTSIDLEAAIKAHAPADKQQLVTELFEQIILYDLKATSLTAKKRPDGRFDVKVTIEAKKLKADDKGKEKDVALAESLDVGFFSAKPGKRDFKPSDVIRVERRPIHSGRQTLEFVLDKAPVWGGIDPYNKVIDRQSDDNLFKAK